MALWLELYIHSHLVISTDKMMSWILALFWSLWLVAASSSEDLGHPSNNFNASDNPTTHIDEKLNALLTKTNSMEMSLQKIQETIDLWARFQEVTAFQQKFEGLRATLNQIDIAVQGLHEKTHTWSIFRHHIDAWNDQMKTFEHKLDLINRGQHGQQPDNRLIRLDLTLNHILSKVIYLIDLVNITSSAATPGQLLDTESSPQPSRDDKKFRNDMSTRLNAISKSLQNLERAKCQRNATPHGNGKGRNGCTAHMANGAALDNVEASLKSLESKVNLLTKDISFKEFRQLSTLVKKSSQDVASMLGVVNSWREDETQHWEEVTSTCASISSELSTFTGSSDLILKRVEMIVRTLSIKLGPAPPLFDGDAESDDNVDVDVTGEGVHLPVNSDEDEGEPGSGNLGPTDFFHANEERSGFVLPLLSACHEITDSRRDGIYLFDQPQWNEAQRNFNERYCRYATDGPAWTVIQARLPLEAAVSFNRSWADYRNGFGDLDKSFWYGNEFIHLLTTTESPDCELRIELEDFDGLQVWAEYSTFEVGDETDNYRLRIDGYRGTVADGMLYQNGAPFSTYDRDNDAHYRDYSCGSGYGSGWWFKNCLEVNLNGVYRNTPMGHNYVGVVWEPWHGDYSLKLVRMMIRPRIHSTARQPDDNDDADSILNVFNGAEDP